MLTALVWGTFGMTLGAAVLHAAIGLRRPVERTYLSFAAIMVLLAVFVYFEWKLYRAETTEAAVEAMRYQVAVGHGVVAGILVFIPTYTRVRIPPLVTAAFWGVLGALFITNLVARYGIWYSGPPLVRLSTLRGEPFNAVVAPPLSLLQYAHTVFAVALFALTITCALKMLRRGQRQRGITLASALVLVIVLHLVDVVRDVVGASWPYFAEYGFVVWGLVMSSQLAIDFRNTNLRLQKTLDELAQRTADLSATIGATLRVRDKLNTPLQTLELGLGMRTARTPDEDETLIELRRAVDELADLGRVVERTASQDETR